MLNMRSWIYNMVKQVKCELCGDTYCTKADKHIKIYFCPKCKSHNVGYMFNLRSVFGLIPKMKCNKCNYESTIFPQIHISEKKLNKLDKKFK